MTPLNIMNGFKVAGIWPLNGDIFSDDEFLTSAVTDRPNPTEEPGPAAIGDSPYPVGEDTSTVSVTTETHEEVFLLSRYV